MIKVEFVSPNGERTHVASFMDEDVYVSSLEALEARASQVNAVVEDSFLDERPILPSWAGVSKILHQGYWYVKYSDLRCEKTI
jgi:hypothetical protein|tara:strand:- start:1391 stop:1639 length:249 start_codon:yes stop_codon:yes gene_type:complete